MRTRGRVDANQKEIVDALRAVGATVEILSGVGKGCCDLLVGYKGVNFLLEVKNLKGRAATKSKERTPAQADWQESWRGQLATVYTPEDALRAIGAPVQTGWEDEARRLHASGRKIDAIKLCRNSTDMGLREAKECVERMFEA